MNQGAGASEDAAYWLAAGMMAEHDPGAATVLDEAIERFPRSRRIANLAAVLDYREDRLDAAEERLVRLLRDEPRDAVALFNLGILLLDQDRFVELADLKAKLDGSFGPRTPLRATAKVSSGPCLGPNLQAGSRRPAVVRAPPPYN